METNHEAEKLNLLLKRNYDAERGYKEAADEVSNTGLKNFFQVNYDERYRFGHDLKEMLKNENAKPDKGTTIEADAHRVFMKLKAMVVSSTPEAILEECKIGEAVAINDYETVINDSAIKVENRAILAVHLKSIRDSVSKIEELKTILA